MSQTLEPGGDRWESLLERRIREALEQGHFADLPGRGQPLDLEDNPFSNPDWRLAHHLLKAHGFVPEWIELDGWIRAELRACRHLLTEATAWAVELARYVDQGRVDPQEARRLWHRQRDQLEQEFVNRARRVNEEIVQFNLIVPVPRLQRAKIDIAAELKQLEENAGNLWV